MTRRSEIRSDNDLVESCLRGEAEAWEKLVRRYSTLVYSVCRRYRLDDDDAADVFQNTWSALWEGLTEVRERKRLASWLITVAGRLSYQQFERRLRQAERQEAGIDPDSQLGTDAEPEKAALAVDEAASVRAAMDRLPERCRQLLDYLFYDPESPSYLEISRRLGVSPDTLGPLRGRCLRHLKTLLDEAGFERR
jgi:RNA polymerase sigma factor (sigma-70 family)